MQKQGNKGIHIIQLLIYIYKYIYIGIQTNDFLLFRTRERFSLSDECLAPTPLIIPDGRIIPALEPKPLPTKPAPVTVEVADAPGALSKLVPGTITLKTILLEGLQKINFKKSE